MSWISDPGVWIALVTLTSLEIVLGIDNIIFLSILTDRLPAPQQPRGRFVGLLLAMCLRIGLLFSLTWIMRLTAPLFSVFGSGISGRDIILIAGGLFLIGKSTFEIHDKLEGREGHAKPAGRGAAFGRIMVQIVLIDIVFSLDSVITAIGMTDRLGVMVAAVVIAVGVMMMLAGAISAFVQRHPTLKMLALSFLLLIGVTLVADGLGQHISKGYIYFAMAFSVFVEMLNLKIRGTSPDAIRLREPALPPPDGK